MREILITLIILKCLTPDVSGQGWEVYLPLVREFEMAQILEAVLRVTDGTTTVDLLGPNSGWRLADPGWRPQIAQYKGGGSFTDSALAEGRTLVHGEYGNVIETIPLTAYGHDQDKAIQTIRELLQLLRQAADYWKESYEYDDVWLEVRPACNDCLTGYSRVVQGRIAELSDPFRQPFFGSTWPLATMEDLSLVVEREPFWRGTEPGTIIGPLYNLLRNPDFELWTQQPGAVADVEPDSWNDIETLWISGTNNRQDSAVHSGSHALRVNVSGSTLAGASKGVTQVAEDTIDNTEYTVLAWVRSEGVSNGVGRILVTYSDQFELYRSGERHGWTLYAATFTTGIGDVVAVHCEILTTGANTDGTVYFDSLMLIEGDWVTEAENGTLPYMSSSHIVNHWDQPGGAVVDAGDINFVDVWDVPGDVDSLIRLEVMNNTEPSDYNDPVEVFKQVRVGQRRAQDVVVFDNYHDPVGVADSACSSGDRLDSGALSTGWVDLTVKTIVGGEVTRHNQGRFRLLARVYDAEASGDPTLQARLSYFLGTPTVNEKTLDAVSAPVRAQWCVLDLTPGASMVQDRKFAAAPPAQLGYRIQMARAVGSAVGRLDYALAMPTDGGYLDAEIDPALTYGNALVVDNTASKSIEGSFLRSGWRIDWNVGETSPACYAMEEFNGDLYLAGLGNIGGTNYGMIWRRRGGTWQRVFNAIDLGWATNPSAIRALKVYQGTLYAGAQAPTPGVIFSTQDGLSWTLAHTLQNNVSTAGAMESFDGLLWVGTSNEAGAPWPSYIETFDGSAWVVARTYTRPLGGNSYRDFQVYNNRLFAIPHTDVVESYNPLTGWQGEVDDNTRVRYVLGSFGGRLYVGTGNAGEIGIFDGESWTYTVVEAGASIRALAEYEGQMFCVTAGSNVYESEDGVTWALSYSSPGAPAWTYGSLGVYQGQLWFAADSSGDISVLGLGSLTYAVSDFRGGPFTCPPSRRHRWVFNYDRENYINNVDDKALVGIGFVPRYLALRGGD